MKRGYEKMERAMEDERLEAARTDPRFRPMRRKEAKVALDSRFNPMLTDAVFDSSEAPVDKLGRRRKKSARENPMLHYYLNKEEGGKKGEEMKLIREGEEDAQDEEASSSSDDDWEQEDDEDQYSVGSDIAHYLMGRHDGTPPIDKETHRLAVVNMEWDHIKAVDLYLVMTSCVPKGGRVLSVSIYPTEFGLKCMNIETTQGPSALIGGGGDDDSGEDENNDDGEDHDDGKEDSDLDSETENKLHTYALNKLRYYYAVVVCDSSATAYHLYQTLDDTEFLSTSNVFDLQFIPDSMEFKYSARDVATEAPLSYEGSDFLFRGLQHSTVKLPWDEDEPEHKIMRRKFKDEVSSMVHPLSYEGSDFLFRGLQHSTVKLPWDEDEPEHKIMRRKFKDELDDIASDDDYSSDESLPNGVAERKLTCKEKLALLLQADNSDKERSDDNIKRESKRRKKGKDYVEDKLAEIDISKDACSAERKFPLMLTSHLSVRKQAGKKRARTLDCEQPVEEPDDAFPKKKANQNCTGNLPMLFAVNPLKRNLSVLRKASKSEDSRTIAWRPRRAEWRSSPCKLPTKGAGGVGS